MLIASFPAGPLQANCYLVGPRAGAGCVVIDPGQDSVDGIVGVATQHELTPEAILVTHGHFDHMWCASDIATKYDIPVWIHPADRHLLADPMAAISNESALMLRQQLGMTEVPEFTEPADVRQATDGAQIDAAGLTFTVDHTPGHTPGTVAYRVAYEGPEDVSELMFTGDFLFAGSIGRTDLNGGDHAAMVGSLTEKVLPLADDVVVLPGHGPQTTVGRERATNPFLAELVDR
ncbi:MBL fold metallo-hydrolase [Solicola gregarius]|uniref:MBL fold metallo-hydrolase n=1 Tax=Solicola gregarius TaxID=2908642 RepID=A0AA46THV7_9ACTN|nr:MBL fold metallo-hydrolase [Solicola gregarius]UYM04808.1 MBL fold metallo-hydrolase [Solicola gregarius]